MTKSIDPKKASGFVKKSEEFLEIAKLALQNEKYNSTVANAIHSAINALDALTTSYKGKRASDDHREVISLMQGIFASKEHQEIKKQFVFLIDKKNVSEYQPDLMDLKDAQSSVSAAQRILERVKKKLN